MKTTTVDVMGMSPNMDNELCVPNDEKAVKHKTPEKIMIAMDAVGRTIIFTHASAHLETPTDG